MLRLLLLLVGARVLRARWRLLVTLGLLWCGLGIAIFADIADDGVLSFPLVMLGLVLLLEGGVEIATTLISGPPVRRGRLLHGGSFIAIAALVFHSGDDNLLVALLFGVAILLDGLFRLISSSLMRCRLWRKKVLFGLLEVALSLMVFANWPLHHHMMVPLSCAAMVAHSGWSLIGMARQLWQLPEEASVITLPMFASRGLRRPHGTAYRHPAFPAAAPAVPLQILIWTPTGSALAGVSDRRPLFDRYLAAVDRNGTIATGHAALELPGELFISHYPLDDIERDFGNFRAALRAGEEFDVPGCFIPSLQDEIILSSLPDRRVVLQHYNAAALRHYWQAYSSDTRYNLTSRNCSTTVIELLDVATEGALGDRGAAILSLLIDPNFWLLWLVRSRAEGMTWTPGLLLDYVQLLKKVLDPAPGRSWHQRVQAALAARRLSMMRLRLKKGAARLRGPL